jgi:hypothetical protein
MEHTKRLKIKPEANSFRSVFGIQHQNFPQYGNPQNRHFKETLYHKGFYCTGTVNEKVSVTINPL